MSGQSEQGDARLVAEVRAAIDRAGGQISFAEYMDLALFAPTLGYYAAGIATFADDGDFVTAPESSPLFARCLGRQIAQILTALGGAEVVEVGAGSGVLAADLLDALAAVDCLPRRYVIVERSAALRDRQRVMLDTRHPALLARIDWLEEIPTQFRGVVIGNEVLDAMPAHRLCFDGGISECTVAWDGGRFCWRAKPLGDGALAEHVQQVLETLGHDLPDGYISEVAPARQAFIAELGTRLAEGVVLLFDYGYARTEFYHPQRNRGTLRCFYRHRAHDDPLILTGHQDISVHVDFTAMAEAATAAELDVAGFTTQAEFLLANDLLQACDGVDPATRQHAELTAQIKRLTLPSQMGEAVKVLALARGFEGSMAGFSGRDLRGRL